MDVSLWRRYARALESRGMLDEARDARARASGHFLRRRCDVLLEHASFEEASQRYDEARRLCTAAAALRPPHLEAVVALANLERRLGELGRMRASYEVAVDLFTGVRRTRVLDHRPRQAARPHARTPTLLAGCQGHPLSLHHAHLQHTRLATVQ